jgi:hypothetical protein
MAVATAIEPDVSTCTKMATMAQAYTEDQLAGPYWIRLESYSHSFKLMFSWRRNRDSSLRIICCRERVGVWVHWC